MRFFWLARRRPFLRVSATQRVVPIFHVKERSIRNWHGKDGSHSTIRKKQRVAESPVFHADENERSVEKDVGLLANKNLQSDNPKRTINNDREASFENSLIDKKILEAASLIYETISLPEDNLSGGDMSFCNQLHLSPKDFREYVLSCRSLYFGVTKTDSWELILKTLDASRLTNLAAYSAYVGDINSCKKILKFMNDFNFSKDEVVFSVMCTMGAYARNGDLEGAENWYSNSLKYKLDTNQTMLSFLIQAHTISGDIEGAFLCLEKIKQMNVVPTPEMYDNLLEACVQFKDLKRAWHLFEFMRLKLFPPNIRTYEIMIRACAESMSVEKAINLFEEVSIKNIPKNIDIYNALIQSYCSRNDYSKRVHEVFSKLIADNIVPNNKTYILLLKAASINGDMKQMKIILNDFYSKINNNKYKNIIFECPELFQYIIDTNSVHLNQLNKEKPNDELNDVFDIHVNHETQLLTESDHLNKLEKEKLNDNLNEVPDVHVNHETQLLPEYDHLDKLNKEKLNFELNDVPDVHVNHETHSLTETDNSNLNIHFPPSNIDSKKSSEFRIDVNSAESQGHFAETQLQEKIQRNNTLGKSDERMEVLQLKTLNKIAHAPSSTQGPFSEKISTLLNAISLTLNLEPKLSNEVNAQILNALPDTEHLDKKKQFLQESIYYVINDSSNQLPLDKIDTVVNVWNYCKLFNPKYITSQLTCSYLRFLVSLPRKYGLSPEQVMQVFSQILNKFGSKTPTEVFPLILTWAGNDRRISKKYSQQIFDAFIDFDSKLEAEIPKKIHLKNPHVALTLNELERSKQSRSIEYTKNIFFFIANVLACDGKTDEALQLLKKSQTFRYKGYLPLPNQEEVLHVFLNCYQEAYCGNFKSLAFFYTLVIPSPKKYLQLPPQKIEFPCKTPTSPFLEEPNLIINDSFPLPDPPAKVEMYPFYPKLPKHKKSTSY